MDGRIETDDGAEIYYRFDGPADGQVVLLSNSLASNLGMWDDQVPALVGAGYRVLRSDTRGHGRSAVTPGPYTIEQLASDVLCLVDRLAVGRIHFIGLSMGGMIGQALAARHADRISSACLCDTSARTPVPSVWDDRIRAAEAGGMAAVVPSTLERWFTPGFRERSPATIERIGRMIAETPVAGFAACCRAIQAMDQRALLPQIEVPTLVVCGEEDPSTTAETARELHAAIAGSEIRLLPDAAHLANVEQPAAFNAVILEFLSRHR